MPFYADIIESEVTGKFLWIEDPINWPELVRASKISLRNPMIYMIYQDRLGTNVKKI
jgi:hypothetical protein